MFKNEFGIGLLSVTASLFPCPCEIEKRIMKSMSNLMNYQNRVEQKFHSYLLKTQINTDRIFIGVLFLQWAFAVFCNSYVVPRMSEHNHHVVSFNFISINLLCSFLTLLPFCISSRYPGTYFSRYTIATAQVLYSSLLISLSGWRIETHFHILGSLVLLAYYRDTPLLMVANFMIAIDHLLGSIFYPEVMSHLNPAYLFHVGEHMSWVVFENIILVYACYHCRKELREISAREVELEQLNASIEQRIHQRTLELKCSEASMRLWKSAFDVARDAVVILTAPTLNLTNLRIMYVNNAFTSITGYRPEEVIGKSTSILHGPKTDPETKKEINSALNNLTSFRAELLKYRKDGSEYWVEVELSPISDENTEYTYWISIQRDVSERKHAEAEFMESREKLSKLATELEEKTIDLELKNNQLSQQHELALSASRAKSEFLANMSHEIRTPLTAILGFTDVLLHDGDITKAPPGRIENINTIKRNGEHLLRVLNDILDLSKIEADKLSIESIVCEPVEVVRDALELMKVRADSKSIKLGVKWDSPIPGKFNSDPMRLKQILVNLIGNAIKFTEVGNVTLHVNYMNEYIDFSVVDTGIGMSPEQILRIFEAFQQADSSMSRKFGGTGLGLIISKRLANLMNGDVELVYSNMGKGTCFRVCLHVGMLDEKDLVDPKVIEATARRIDPIKVEAMKNTPQLAGFKILYAEDGIDNQRLVSFMMKKQGADIDIAENGEMAIDLFEKAKLSDKPYDIILMDMQMPVMDGYQAAGKLRELGETIPVIALTAHAMSGEKDKCVAAGCTDYTTKPIKKEELIGMILKYSLKMVHAE